MNDKIELGKYDALNVNLSEYSYTETDVNYFLSGGFDIDFNHEIYYDLTSRKIKLDGINCMLIFYDEKLEGKYSTPNLISPLDFFNLLYHEFDFIVKNQLQPIECLKRIRNLQMSIFLKIYFLQCLERLLIKTNIRFLPDRLFKERVEVFKKINPNAIDVLERSILNLMNFHLEKMQGMTVDDKIKYLFSLESIAEKLPPELPLNSLINQFIKPKLEHLQKLKANGILYDELETPQNTSTNNLNPETLEPPITDIKGNDTVVDTESTKSEEKVEFEAMVNSIKSEFKRFDYCLFVYERDYEYLLNLLAMYFLNYELEPFREIHLKPGNKNKAAAILNIIYKNNRHLIGNQSLIKNNSFHQIVRLISDFKNDKQINKSIGRGGYF